MTPSGPARPQELPASQQALGDYMRQLLGRVRPRRVLQLCPSNGEIHCLSEYRGVLLTTVFPPGSAKAAALVCDLAELPFGDQEFDMVILHHLVSDGLERELDEACRVLRAGGHILVTGRGVLAARVRARKVTAGLKAGRISRALGRRGFRVADSLGMGPFGRDVKLERRWQRPLFVFCEQILVRARHQERESMVRPLRFSRPSAARARGAALDGLSRQAAP